uniref:AGC-kinase C-terminal domain-containing protein n=1 Tax=Trichobilharzia regenti TaxID=157069 RepID=A0AA85K5P6_TRIRE|nr:unnamed protein product [Trichobilharzia regenti]
MWALVVKGLFSGWRQFCLHMSDAEYIADGPLTDIVGADWGDDTLPFELILVKPDSLPDPEPQPVGGQRCFEVPASDFFDSVCWNELDLDNLLTRLNPPLTFHSSLP